MKNSVRYVCVECGFEIDERDIKPIGPIDIVKDLRCVCGGHLKRVEQPEGQKQGDQGNSPDPLFP